MTSRRDALKSAALLPLAATPLATRAAPAVSGVPVAGHFRVLGAPETLLAVRDGIARISIL